MAATPMTISASPLTSRVRGTVSSRDSSTELRTRTTTAALMGTFIQKISRQVRTSVKNPPMNGPSALPIIPMAKTRPMARWTRSWGKALVTTARLTGNVIAAPAPWSTRKTMAVSAVGAEPASADVAAKMTRPMISSRFRP